MGPRVFVTYARENGPDDAQRLTGVLEPALGVDAVVLAAPIADVAAVEHSEVVVALIGPGWRAGDDALAQELTHAFEHRIPVIAMLARGAQMPTREELPAPLRPLLDSHPRLTLQMPSDFYWDVTTSHLGRWLRAIGEEYRRAERARVAAAEAATRAGRDLARMRERLAEAEANEAAAAPRRATVEAALREAAQALERHRAEGGAARTGPGLRVYISYRAESGGDVRTLERDLREQLDDCRLSSSEPIPDSADPVAIAEERIGRADVVLAVLGPNWTGGASGPRLEDGTDAVRLELEAALRRGLTVIPVLTQRATMPSAAELPESLRVLAGDRAFELIVAFWNDGIADLVARLHEIDGGLRQRAKALDDAAQQHRRLEREEESARADEAKAAAATRTARDRVTALEEQLQHAGEEEERLRHEHRDSNRAYLDGPGPITLDGSRSGVSPRRPGVVAVGGLASKRLMVGALAVLALVVILIVAFSH